MVEQIEQDPGHLLVTPRTAAPSLTGANTARDRDTALTTPAHAAAGLLAARARDRDDRLVGAGPQTRS